MVTLQIWKNSTICFNWKKILVYVVKCGRTCSQLCMSEFYIADEEGWVVFEEEL